MGKLRYAFPVLILIFVLVLTACGGDKTTTPATTTEPTTMTTITGGDEMIITATAFEDGGEIPAAYSCDGQDKSPELNWMNVPEGTQSFALILDDPDAPGGTFTHWVIFNIPAGATGLVENSAKIGELPDGSLQGKNGFGAIGYGGPCPPSGSSHRYYFTLYALDTPLVLASGATKAQVMAAMEGHVLAEAELMGNYQR
jgi:Raf kinase inhibitor-like YbhB/YbcL family protein